MENQFNFFFIIIYLVKVEISSFSKIPISKQFSLTNLTSLEEIELKSNPFLKIDENYDDNDDDYPGYKILNYIGQVN